MAIPCIIGTLISCVCLSCSPTEPAEQDTGPWQPKSASELRHNGKGMVLIEAKGRSFIMGTTTTDFLDVYPHKVSFTHDYWMDTTHVTQIDYFLLMGVNPWDSSRGNLGRGPDLPAYLVNWYEAALYCNARSKRDGLDTVYKFTGIAHNVTYFSKDTLLGLTIDYSAYGYRMPTEAEWEYAARGGASSRFFWGEDTASSVVTQYAWYSMNADTMYHPVAQKLPNPYGLYDVEGNASNKCNDWWGDWSTADATDPTGPSSYIEKFRVIRGADFMGQLYELESWYRTGGLSMGWVGGFRCILPVR